MNQRDDQWIRPLHLDHREGSRLICFPHAGGSASSARYEVVSGGTTGHAESVQLTYDPAQISYPRLLEIFFMVAHDPTQVDRQGPDSGKSYRSAIFPQSPQQAQIARSFIIKLNTAHVFKAPIATRIESGGFYPAEAYHQHFAEKHPFYPYIVINDRPKVAALQKRFPSLWKA